MATLNMTFEEQLRLARAFGVVDGVSKILEDKHPVHEDIAVQFVQAVEMIKEMLFEPTEENAIVLEG